MKVFDEFIHRSEGIRMQCIKWKDMVWNIYCNDRFNSKDFKVKVHCEICGPKVFVPKVIEHRGHRLCNSCLTRMIEMLQAATRKDCNRSPEQVKTLEIQIKTAQTEKEKNND